MEIYTPAFIEIKKLLTPIILKSLKDYHKLGTMDIGKIIKGMKEKDEKKFALISFIYLSDYSDQVQNVIVDMIRHCLVEQIPRGYELTSLGKKRAKSIHVI